MMSCTKVKENQIRVTITSFFIHYFMRCHVGFHADSSHFSCCGLMLMEPAAISSSTSQNDTNKKHLLGYIGKTFDLFYFLCTLSASCYSVTWSIWDLRSNSSPIRFRFTHAVQNARSARSYPAGFLAAATMLTLDRTKKKEKKWMNVR